MVAGINIGGSIEIGGGIVIGDGGPSFSLTTADFTNFNIGGGAEGDNTGFVIGGSHNAGETFYGPILSANNGGNAVKSAEILVFWNANGLNLNDNSYLFDVTWGPGSSTNTVRNVVVMSFYYSDVNSTSLLMGAVDTNITGWDTPGQNPFGIAAANGTFLLPATFTLIQPPIQDISSWC